MKLFRHLILRFNYGVEIGARLAYLGHYRAIGDQNILLIANEELDHRNEIEKILLFYNKKPTLFFNIPFTIVGNVIFALCQVSPKKLLDFVAMSMEIFAIFSYNKLALLYPEYSNKFIEMSNTESKHKLYFSKDLNVKISHI